MFGSTANGKARPDSDVDMFFDHDKGTIGLIELDAITRITARALGKEVDIMTRDSLHPALRRQIETAALRVF
jgi:predicted nucleotidyltransferase